MRLTLTLARSGDRAVDLVISTDADATIGDLAHAVVIADPERGHAPPPGPVTLRVLDHASGTVLDPQAPLRTAGLRSGAVVRTEPVSAQFSVPGEGRGPAAAMLRVLAGPDRGKEFALPVGSTLIGRDRDMPVRLRDPMVSKRHARISVGDSIEMTDLGSANGLLVDGTCLAHLRLDSGTQVMLGDTLVAVAALRRVSGEAASGPVVRFVRSPRVVPAFEPTEVASPAPSRQPSPRRFPLVALAAPVLMGAVLYMATRNPMSLIFVALSPIIMVGSWLDSVVTGRRLVKDEAKRFAEAIKATAQEIEDLHDVEREVRRATHPSVGEIGAAIRTLGAVLWSQRPEHSHYVSVRLGTATMPSACTLSQIDNSQALASERTQLGDLAALVANVSDVPVVSELRSAGALGLAGARARVSALARAVVLQLVGLHSPAEVSLAAFVSAQTREDWRWLAWLPHTAATHAPVGVPLLADDPASGAGLLGALEGLIAARSGRDGIAARHRGHLRPQDDDSDEPEPPVVLVLVEDSAPVDRARLTSLSESGADVGVHVIWVAAAVEDLPAACRDFVMVSDDGRANVGFVRRSLQVDQVEIESLGLAEAAELARRLAPVEDAGALVADESGLPHTVPFLSAAGLELGSDPNVQIERWRETGSLNPVADGSAPGRAGTLRALVGQTATDPMVLDLRSQGPHALVGGTTGSGKSEFLQSWVLGMATAHSPNRVTFLLVDYKGGAAFADCVDLPHTVGLVTDLSQHMVRRALTSLRAELRFREHLLNRKKAKDLVSLEKTGDPDAPPSLVIVVDEFAALATEVPEFVDGVVDVAQRGRSLGLHLILATQRPAGVIKDNLRANTNLRIALRMADEDDSKDVLGTPMAAHVDPSLPGRAAVRTGPGRIVPFQSCYVGGHTSEAIEHSAVEISELGFGRGVSWDVPQVSGVAVTPEGPTDIERVVQVIRTAAQLAQIAEPRKPWLPVLARAYDLSRLRQRTDARLALGVVDDPHRQEQRTSYFTPDIEGNLAVFGAGGSGKSVTLRTLAAAASITPRGGPVHVYGLDFAGGALGPLEVLPNVGSVISGDDAERVARLVTRIREVIEERSVRYARHRASTIEEYRALAGAPKEPRYLILLDGFGTFRHEYESAPGRAATYQGFTQILVDGRAVGVHVALTADRPGAVPGAVASSIQRTVVLRQSDENAYLVLDAPRDVLSATSAPGRAIDLPDGLEMQIGVLGGSPSLAEQARALERLAASIPSDPAYVAEPIRRLPEVVAATTMPDDVAGQPVLGVADDTLAPVGFDPSGTFIISGPMSSGRSTTILQLAGAIRRWNPATEIYHVTGRMSALSGAAVWTRSERSLDQIVDLAKALAERVAVPAAEGRPPVVVVIEALSDFLGGPAEGPLTELIKQAKRNGHLVIAEADSASWGSSWPLVVEVRSGRRGIALQPDQMDGDLLFRTGFPRITRTEFPPGRGLMVASGKVRRVQIPLPQPVT